MRSKRWTHVAAAMAILAQAAAQSCYYAANKLALEEYVPCAGGSGTTSCCLAGDFCLSDGACFSPGTQMTYIAGCTDPTFQDSTCRGGDTCKKDTNFQAMALCGNDWVCCGGQGQTGDIPSNDYSHSCPCNVGYGTAIADAGSLSQIASLASTFPTTQPSSTAAVLTTASDTSTAASSTAVNGQTSSAVSSAAQTTDGGASTSESNQSGSTPAATGSPSNDGAQGGQGSDNSQALKIGLGVGISLGLALIALGIGGFFLMRRRRRERSFVTQEDLSTAVWQGESSGGAAPRAMPATEATAYYTAVGNQKPGSTAYAPMREVSTPPPQYPPSRDGGNGWR